MKPCRHSPQRRASPIMSGTFPIFKAPPLIRAELSRAAWVSPQPLRNHPIFLLSRCTAGKGLSKALLIVPAQELCPGRRFHGPLSRALDVLTKKSSIVARSRVPIMRRAPLGQTVEHPARARTAPAGFAVVDEMPMPAAEICAMH